MTNSVIKKLGYFSITFVSFMVLWLSFLSFPATKVVNLDTSWQQAFAYFFKQGWQAGIDYVFTYGPFAYLSLKEPSYQGDLFYFSVLWWIVASLLFALLFIARASQLTSWLERFIYLVVLAVIVSEVARFGDSFYFLWMTGSTILLLHPPIFLNSPKRYLTVLTLIVITFSILSLAKFTFLLFAGVCLLGISTVLWQRFSFKIALFTWIEFILLFIGMWSLCQQSLTHLPAFFSRSWQITNFYSEAMSYHLDFRAVEIATYEVFLISILIIFNYLSTPKTLAKLISSGILLMALFLNWKSSFVRYETLIHGVMFFCFAVMLPFFIERKTTLIRPFLLNGLIFTNLFAGLVGIFYIVLPHGYTPETSFPIWFNKMARHITTLGNLPAYKSYHDYLIESTLRKKHELPHIQNLVGYERVDMFPPQQGTLFLNGLNYHPRPLFQGYAAYTETLLQINGEFYQHSDTAPRFVLFKMEPLDSHFPTLEDSQTLNVLLNDYKPIFWEKGFFLLQHSPRHPITTQTLFTQEVAIGELVNLQDFNNKPLFLSLDVQKSFLGKLSTFLIQLPSIWLEIETTLGEKFTYRLLPSISRANFLINPLLLEENDWLQWFLGHPQRKLASLRVKVKSDNVQYLFNPTIMMTLSEADLTPYPFDERTKSTLEKIFLSRALQTLPDHISSSYSLVNFFENNQNQGAALITPTPAEMQFKVREGHYEFSGQFGVIPEYDMNLKASQHTLDQVEFSAAFVESSGQEKEIFKTILQPLAREEDRTMRNFNVSFKVRYEGHIVLRAHALPSQSPLGRVAFWRAVQLARQE